VAIFKILAAGLVLSVAGVGLLQPNALSFLTGQFASHLQPVAQNEQGAPKLDRISTSSILSPPSNGSTDFAQALDALTNDDYDAARSYRDTLPKTSLEFKTVSWVMAYFAGMHLPRKDIEQAANLAAGWPGADVLQLNRERALLLDNLTNVQIIATFATKPPQSFEGALLLARAYKSDGKMPEAVSALSPFWLTEALDAAKEKAVIDEFGAAIPIVVHQGRLQKMLFDSHIASAGHVAELANSASLYKAWSAVIRKDKAAGKLLDAVPEQQRVAGYYFAKARYLRRQGKISAAAKVMLLAPRNATGLIGPDELGKEQLILARDLIDLKQYDLAYQIAAGHVAGTPAKQADSEFHAGWIALRFLNNAAKSLQHFKNLAAVTDGPVSQARAYYWLGRAVEAGAEGNSTEYFTSAASFATTYYGQLAAAKLGLKNLNIATPIPTAVDHTRFDGREWVLASKMLIGAGHAWRATPLINALADNLSSPGELALLADMAEAAGQSKLALQVGKSSAYRGINVGALTHPLGAIPDETQLSDAGRALAYAVARQESEFHVGAKSGAGALGLLQLLPATAKEVATRAGLEYSQVRLTSDGGYNATLGARYLSEQIDRFDGSYILTFIAYNAGPRRAEQWVKRYGNPQGKLIEEVVDFVELIPFSETRSYVQRVMENYQVYKWRLNGQYDIVQDLRFGRK
jgi:soluble lytic murein transglycosylase